MHSAQRATNATGATLGAAGVAAGSQDHIITISTASIDEAHADEDAHQLKQHQQQQQHQTEQHTAVELAAAPTSRKRPLCQLSQLVSFQNNIADVHHRKGRRLHGLQLPLHPLQLFGWLVLVLFGLASYCVLIPAFSAPLQGPLYGLISGLYFVHIGSHLAALLTDPADKELRRVHRNDRIVPEFDRTKHAHVIENGRCHLCNIRTSSPRTKHCSVCNKCVGKFDHHCKWLNHCIGSRNYVAFLMCVVSAVVATLVIVAAVIAQIVLYYVQPEWLSFYGCSSGGDVGDQAPISIGSLDLQALDAANEDNFINLTLSLSNGSLLLLEEPEEERAQNDVLQNSTLPTLLDNFTAIIQQTATPVLSTLSNQTSTSTNTPTLAGIGVNETIFLLLIGLLGLLAAISAGLLLHLCFFHIYISFLGLTTYEYIRNHRQAQEAKSKQLHNSTLPKNGVHFSPAPPSQQQRHTTKPSGGECAQIFCCASVRHPNDASDVVYLQPPPKQTEQQQQQQPGLQLHCCSNSREFHQQQQQRISKSIYVCSLLEERTDNGLLSHNLGVAPYDLANAAVQPLRTFHCCSSFAASALQRRVSAANAKATLLSDVEAAAAANLSATRARSYLQYTEQCTFCTFRMRSPLLPKRSSSSSGGGGSGSNSTRTLASTQNQPAANGGGLSAAEHQRCCMKSISKHQRWRRKWNCCSSVPDSPDVPNDLIAALAYRHQQQADGAKINATELPVQFIRTLNGSGGADASPRSAASAGTLKSQTSSSSTSTSSTTRNARTWPVARLRHMMRMLGRYRRPRCRHHHGHVAAAEQHKPQQQPQRQPQPLGNVKSNQIRPLQLEGRREANGYYDSSTPQPPSQTPTSSEHDSATVYTSSECSGAATPSTNELILPTSVIRDDSVTTYTLTLPPALPPPTRRKMPNPTDLEELAETLGFAVSHTHPSGPASQQQQQQQRLPALGNVYRRQRRKHFLRTRSPTLSPIHESGLSNPTSPQPGRHAYNNSASTNCSPAVARSTALVNNLCGIAGEALRKAASNSSLQSVSSNSSST